METRANHILIGGFVLIAVLGFFSFVIWMTRLEIDREFAYYSIYFSESVSGLSVGGDVRYNGIPVGRVTAIEIDPDRPSDVKVTVEVASETAIRADTVATLELQGITGVSFVQLTGGSVEAPLLKPGSDGEPPEIASRRSAFKEIFAGAPEMINRISLLVSEMTKLVDENNRTAIAEILQNGQVLSERLARRAPEIERLIVDMQKTASDLSRTAQRVDGLLQRTDEVLESADATMAVARGALTTVDGVLDQDARLALRDVRDASARFGRLSSEIELLVAENREPLNAFSEDGLVQFTRFVEEARQLVASASRLVEDIEQDPKQFLFGDQQQGFEAQ